MNLREEILRFGCKQRFEPFEAFGQKLSIRVITARERDWYEGIRFDVRGASDTRLKFENARAAFVCVCLGDADGKRIFTDGDLAKVGELPHDEVDRILDAGFRVNGMSAESAETVRKNSGTAQLDGSSSVLPVSCGEPLANCSTH